MLTLIIYIINQHMSDSEEEKYSWHEVVYHTNDGTVPRVITVNDISIIDAIPDDEYVPMITSVYFVLDKLKKC